MKTAYRKAARQKRQQREQHDSMAWTLAGFSIAFDPITGRKRNWYQNAGDVKRWADNDEPVEEVQT